MANQPTSSTSVGKEGLDILAQRGYRTFVKLDSGGQGRVYKTVKNNRIYACKVVSVDNPKGKMDDDLMREITITKNLKNPNCIKVVDLFRSKNKIYIMMEFMPNGTIGSYVRKRGPLCEWNTKSWFCPIARAVKYLHDNRIAHRDIKLDNILLDSHMNPILTDFGFGKFVSIDPKDQRVEKSDTFCGTLSYYPPEVLIKTPYDPFKADVWCLGISLFIMLNQIYPFDRKDKKKMYENQINRNYKLRTSVDQKISQDVKDLVRKLLEPVFSKRISTAEVCNDVWFPIDSRNG